MSAYHFLEPRDNGYVTKRYSFIIKLKSKQDQLLVCLLLGKISVLVYQYDLGNF